jgi:tetratricopeptide (TPR) repeat protein
MTGQGLFSIRLGYLERGQVLLQQSLSLLHQIEDGPHQQLAFSLFWLAHAYLFQGQYPEARHHFEESLAVFTEVGDQWGIGVALAMLGGVTLYQGTYVEANQLLQESVRVLDQVGDPRWRNWSILLLGLVVRAQGKYEQAKHSMRQRLLNL